MKNHQLLKLLFFAIGIIFILSATSCTIEKRIHRKGFHVSFNHIGHKRIQPFANHKTKEFKTLSLNEKTLFENELNPIIKQHVFEPVASMDNDLILVPEKKNKILTKPKINVPLPKFETIISDLDTLPAKKTEVKEYKYKKSTRILLVILGILSSSLYVFFPSQLVLFIPITLIVLAFQNKSTRQEPVIISEEEREAERIRKEKLRIEEEKIWYEKNVKKYKKTLGIATFATFASILGWLFLLSDNTFLLLFTIPFFGALGTLFSYLCSTFFDENKNKRELKIANLLLRINAAHFIIGLIIIIFSMLTLGPIPFM